MYAYEERLSGSAAETGSADDTADEEMLGSMSSSDTAVLLPEHKESRWRRLVFEPAVFLIFFAIGLSDSVFQNQVLYQTCIAVFQHNATTCEPLIGVTPKTAETQSIESQVQVYVSNIIMVNSIIRSVIPAIMSLFIGPWSDKVGRRPVILIIVVAYILDYITITTLAVISTQTDMSPWLYLFSSMCSVLCGGSCAAITTIYSYVSDVADEESKAVRMLVMEAFLGLGIMIGGLSSPYILAATNFITVFGISLITIIVATIYVYFLVPESLKTEQIPLGAKLRAFFHFELVMDLLRTSFKRRPDYKRAIIWLTIISLTITRFTADGENNIVYLFVTKQFSWTIQDYNLFKTVRSVGFVVGGIFGVVVVRQVFKCSLVFITMISYVGAVAESLVRAVAAYPWELYMGVGLGFMSGVPSSVLITILSHVTPATEVGKIFALTTALGTLAPFASAPMYTAVYDATLDSYPGVYNFISVSLYLICFVLIAGIYGIEKSMGTPAGP